MVEMGSWGTGLPFQGLVEAIKRKKKKSYCRSTKSHFSNNMCHKLHKCLLCIISNINFTDYHFILELNKY